MVTSEMDSKYLQETQELIFGSNIICKIKYIFIHEISKGLGLDTSVHYGRCFGYCLMEQHFETTGLIRKSHNSQ